MDHILPQSVAVLQLSFLIQDDHFITAFNSFKAQVFLGELYSQPLYWLLLR